MPYLQLPFNPIPTWEQSNPIATGFDKAQQSYGQLLQNALNQVNAQYAQPNAEQNLQQAILQNKYYGPNMESQIGQRNAQTGILNYQLQNPYLLASGLPQEIEYLKSKGYIGNSGNNYQQNNYEPSGIMSGNPELSNEEAAQKASLPPVRGGQGVNYSNAMPGMGGLLDNIQDPYVKARLMQPFVAAQLQAQQLSASNWIHEPENARLLELSYANAMGITPDAYIKDRMKGKTLEEIAQSKGYNVNQLTPEPLGSPASYAQLADAKAGQAAMRVIEPFIKEGLGEYAGSNVAGIPLEFLADRLSGMNKDKQAKFLAAYPLALEESAFRAGQFGTTGSEAINAFREATYQDMSRLEGLPIDKEVFNKAQELLSKKIEQAFGARQKAYSIGGTKENKEYSIPKVIYKYENGKLTKVE